MDKPKEILGDLEFVGKDIPSQKFRYDRIALDRKNNIMLLSVVAESQAVKAIRSILNGGAKADIKASGGKVRQPDALYGYPSNPGNITPTAESYACHTQKLDYGLVHAVFVTRHPGFMPVMTPETLWRELSDTRFTTPIIREWLPWIEKRLKELDLLNLCESFNFPYEVKAEDGTVGYEVMRCGILEATTEKLDEIVSDGLRRGEITIPGPTGSNLDPRPTQEAMLAEMLLEVFGDSIPTRETTLRGIDSILHPIAPEPETPAGPKSWRIACDTGEGKPSYNGCFYSTKEKAEAAGADLYSRWTMLKSYAVEPSDHEPNY